MDVTAAPAHRPRPAQLPATPPTLGASGPGAKPKKDVAREAAGAAKADSFSGAKTGQEAAVPKAAKKDKADKSKFKAGADKAKQSRPAEGAVPAGKAASVAGKAKAPVSEVVQKITDLVKPGDASYNPSDQDAKAAVKALRSLTGDKKLDEAVSALKENGALAKLLSNSPRQRVPNEGGQGGPTPGDPGGQFSGSTGGTRANLIEHIAANGGKEARQATKQTIQAEIDRIKSPPPEGGIGWIEHKVPQGAVGGGDPVQREIEARQAELRSFKRSEGGGFESAPPRKR